MTKHQWPWLEYARLFLRSRRGAIAPLAALSIGIFVLPMVGISVDLTRQGLASNVLQDALDSAGLAAARLPRNATVEELQVVAQAWLNANLTDSELQGATVTVLADSVTITLDAVAQLPTTVAGMVGVPTMTARAHTEVKRGPSHVELALVLDNTGSMLQDDKLETLISSANGLVDTLVEAIAGLEPGALKIAVVPFSQTVNIGSGYRNATWMSGTQPGAYGSDVFSSSVDRFALFDQMGVAWNGCVEARPQPYDVQDTAPSTATSGTLFTPYFAPDEPDNGTIQSGSSWWGPTYYTFPNNYLADGVGGTSWQTRQGNQLKYVSAPVNGTNPSTGYIYGPNAGCSLTPLLRLTTDFTAVHTKINQMQAVGDTNIPFGLVWGWHVLSPNTPFADGGAYATAALKKIVVLLTDGENTMTSASNPDASYYSGLGYIWQSRLGISSGTSSQRTTAINGRMTTLCTNMKAQGIIIFTVRIDLGGVSPASLQSCASGDNRFYDVPDVEDLPEAFQQIAQEIGAIRLSQ